MVADMNAAATTLGLRATSYADTSGLDPASASTAVDPLHLAEVDMRDPVFAAIVRLRAVWLPVAGVVTTYTPYLGQPGVVGIKTGYTSVAKGCDVMAYDVGIGRHEVQIIAVVLGQYPLGRPLTDLQVAARNALVLVTSVARHLAAWKVATRHVIVGTLGWGGRTVPVVATGTVIVPTFSSTEARSVATEGTWPDAAVPPGHVVGAVAVASGAYRGVTAFVTTALLTKASLWDRLR